MSICLTSEANLREKVIWKTPVKHLKQALCSILHGCGCRDELDNNSLSVSIDYLETREKLLSNCAYS